jgi:hypothetical protein
MNKRPGHVVVTTEVAMCSFCGRPRTLRNEQHQLGTLVRTIVTCETCHRTLSSFIAVASAETAVSEPAALETQLEQKPAAEDRPAKTAAATPKSKPAAAKPKAAASKPKTPAKRSPRTK